MKAKDRKRIEEAARMYETLRGSLWDAMVRQLAEETELEPEEVESLFGELT